jgi:hypothetical protein
MVADQAVGLLVPALEYADVMTDQTAIARYDVLSMDNILSVQPSVRSGHKHTIR